jgi:hypothetical protein
MECYGCAGHDGFVIDRPTYIIDGRRVRSLEDFWTAIGEAVNGPGGYFASNMDAFEDALAGGMGQPDDGRCTFVWTHSEESRSALGYPETVRQLELRLAKCHPTSRPLVEADLENARSAVGPSVFDWLVEAIEGSPARLRLE